MQVVIQPEGGESGGAARARSGRPDAPSAPELVVAKSTALKVDWRPTVAGAAAKFYEVQFAETSLISAWNSASCEVEDEEYSVRQLEPSTRYVFRARGGNDWGWGPWSGSSEPFQTLKAGRPPVHAFVLVHGLGSSPESMAAVADALEDRHGDSVYIIKSVWNASPQGSPRGGVDLCGSRLALEVQERAATVTTLRTISFVAHGTGGLYARYALRDLAAVGVFDALTPLYFCTLGCPHAGDTNGAADVITGALRKRIAGTTGEQVRLEDDADDSGMPLLAHMATPEFTDALRLFRHRVLYTDVAESTTPYSSASLLDVSPFADASPAQLAAMQDAQYGIVLRVAVDDDDDDEETVEFAPSTPTSPRTVAGGASPDTAVEAEGHVEPMLTADEYRQRIIEALQRLSWRRQHVWSRARFRRDDDMVVRWRWLSSGPNGLARHVADEMGLDV